MYETFLEDADADTYLDMFAPGIIKTHEKNKANKIYYGKKYENTKKVCKKIINGIIRI